MYTGLIPCIPHGTCTIRFAVAPVTTNIITLSLQFAIGQGGKFTDILTAECQSSGPQTNTETS